MSASDPFYAVQSALESEVQQLRINFDQWRGLLETCNTATDTAFIVKHDEMKSKLSKMEDQCRKVRQAVLNVERNRVKYPHIDDRELASRKGFCDTMDRAVLGMKEAFLSREVQGKLDSDKRKELHARAVQERETAGKQANAYHRANADYLSSQQQEQQQIRRQQDQTLDKMGSSLDTLGEMARAIDAELQDQGKMLEDLEEKIDETQGKMDGAIKSIEKLLGTKSKWQMMTIFVLVVIFLILAVVAFM